MIETDRLVAAAPASSQEEILERALRPKQLEEYVGQERFVGNCRYSLKQPEIAMKRLIMFCYSARQV